MLIQIFKILQLIHTTVRNITLFHAHTQMFDTEAEC